MIHRNSSYRLPSSARRAFDSMGISRSHLREMKIGRRTIRDRLCSAIVLICLIYFNTPSLLSTSNHSQPLKQILFYNKFWTWPDFKVGLGHEPFSHCRIKTCQASSKAVNNSLSQNMSNYDAVVIHGVDFYLDDRTNKYIKSWRLPHQRIVFFMLEPPTIGPSYSSPIYNYFWNYTMTYRRDSDVIRPYGYFVLKQHQSNGGIPKSVKQPQVAWPIDYNEADFVSNILPTKGSFFRGRAKKPRKIAWVASNCQTKSRRESFVIELQKYIDIDVFGKCGSAVCDFQGAQVSTGNCSTTIARDYKFYLSFENNFARDYVSEKFFARMSSNLVPIVLGQADYKLIAPPHSFINVLDYESPKALADFLHKLDRNETEYLSYFWWQHYYHAESVYLQRLSFCDLCAKLHEDLKPQSYPNFEQWWHTDSLVQDRKSVV